MEKKRSVCGGGGVRVRGVGEGFLEDISSGVKRSDMKTKVQQVH